MTSTLSPHDTDAEYRTLNLANFLRPDRLRRPDATGEQPVYQPEPVVVAEAVPTVYRSDRDRPRRYRGERRVAAPPHAPAPLWAVAVTAFAAGVMGGVVVLALAVLQAGGAW